MKRPAYPPDLTDAQWEELAPLLPPAKPGGHPRTVDLREVSNGILYVLRSGCSWRMPPHDLPPWGAVWWYFRQWRLNGVWAQVHEPGAPGSGKRRDGRLPPAPPSADFSKIAANRLRPRKKGGRGATTLARRSMDASDTLW